MNSSDFDIILPCYNPLAGWQETVVDSYRSLTGRFPNKRIKLIIVNDGTTKLTWTDGINELRRELPNALIIESPENRGKGHALRVGASQSTASYCLFTDIDFPYTEASLASIAQMLEAGAADIVIGQRPESYYASVPLPRLLLSKAFRAFLRLVYGLKFRDSQCGLKGFNSRGRAVLLSTETNRYLVDLEFLLLAASQKLAIDAQAVTLREGIVFSKLGIAAIAKEITSLITILYRVLLVRKELA